MKKQAHKNFFKCVLLQKTWRLEQRDKAEKEWDTGRMKEIEWYQSNLSMEAICEIADDIYSWVIIRKLKYI